MKEITRISLASLPYNIEVKAKKDLEHYLEAIQKSLKADDEAMKEIEARIAELLSNEGVRGEKVVTYANFEAVKKHLGEPSAFASDDEEATDGGAQTARSEKQLMRDVRGGMVGGVCAGLAAYFHIDTVWVRLGMLLLVPFTAGFAFLLYIVLWIVMPPARSAAERLQMRGEAVTPAAIRDESNRLIEPAGRNTILNIARIFGGITSLFGAVGAFLATIAQTMYFKTMYDDYTNLHMAPPWPIIIGMIVGGVLTTLFFALLSYVLLKEKYTKRHAIILAVLGLGIAATFIGGYTLVDLHPAATLQNNATATKALDASSLARAKRLKVNSELPITVNYNVDPTRREATLWYNPNAATDALKVSLVTDDAGVLAINVPQVGSSCLPDVSACHAQYTVTILGPELESVESPGLSMIRYNVDKQSALKVSAKSNGQIELNSTGKIDMLEAELANEGRLYATKASIQTAKLVVDDNLSNADFAIVKNLAITLPEACAQTNGQGAVTLIYSDNLTVNGKAFDTEKSYPCGKVTVTNSR